MNAACFFAGTAQARERTTAPVPTKKNPQASRGMRVFGAKRRDAPDHMLSIMTWPKPEQDTWVAPSSKRAKS